MTEADLQLLISNHLTNFSVSLEKLIESNFPRGLFNSYESCLKEISELNSLKGFPNFHEIYKEEIERHYQIFIGTELETITTEIIANSNDPENLETYCNEQLIKNFPNFWKAEKIYISELIISNSRASTKKKYFEKLIERLYAVKSFSTGHNHSFCSAVSKAETYVIDLLKELN